jgi:class 3 adenylate cyclase
MSAQRRVVTVLFADIVGSSGMAEALDPEDLQQLLASYYRTSRDVIETHGGTVEKFIGDAVMAIFGVPQAHDDDARRAIAAAVALRQRIRADPRLGERLPIRIGINTGEVASSTVEGAGQALVAGDPVNVAARLQQQAEPWTILVGERTATAAAADFAFGPPLDVTARGRSASVSAREVIAERRSPPPPTPFVGRDHDLAQLQLISRRVFDEGRPWVVTIVAPPGTGKTRLLHEFLGALPADAAQPLVVVARCLPYGERLVYQPLRAVATGLVGLADDARPDLLLARLQALLTDAGVGQPERTAELLAATVGAVDMPLAVQPHELSVAWRSFIEGAARQRPIVLAIEDLHWASDSMLELIEFALQPVADVPALLVAVARPELFDRRTAWSAGRRNQTTIDLSPLGDGSIERIVRHLLPSVERQTVESVVARADGNPFFALEIARSVAERPSAGKLPDTVQATIQARLDRLDPADRQVIEAGAIFGRSFDVRGVAALSGLAPTAIRGSIDRLVERGLLVAGEGDEASASHILIRDVAYSGQPRVQRAVLHRAAADWLMHGGGSAGQVPAELIAVHYRESAALAALFAEPPRELDGVRPLAVAWLRRAAERALAAAASTDAVGHLQAAVELAATDELAALYERMGDANLNPQAALAAYGQALENARSGALEPTDQLRLVGKLLLLHTRSQGGVAERLSPDDMHALLQRGAQLEQLATDELAVARFLIARAFMPFWSGGASSDSERQAARADAQRGLGIAERRADADLRSAALDALGSVAETWPDALQHARRRLAFAAQLELSERIDAHSTAAWSAYVTGELGEAERITAAGMDLLQPGQVPSYALHLAAWRIGALRQLGRWDELVAEGERAVELWESTGRSAAGYATRGFADLLEVARARGDEEAASRYVRILEEIYGQFPGKPGTRRNEVLVQPRIDLMAAYLTDLGEITTQAKVYGQIDGYERVLSRLLDEGGRLDADAWERVVETSLRLGCRLVAAQALRAIGLARSSADQLSRALELAEAASAQPLIGRLKVDLGGVLGDATALAAGLGLLRELGDLEHLARPHVISSSEQARLA